MRNKHYGNLSILIKNFIRQYSPYSSETRGCNRASLNKLNFPDVPF